MSLAAPSPPVAAGRTESFFRLALSSGIPKRSAIVAAIVGTILNAINQGDVILNGGTVDILKAALTYCVPYCVATYAAVAYARQALKARASSA